MSTKPQDLKKIIDDLRQIIVGKVAMPPDQIEQITLFLFLKQLSKKHDNLVRIKSEELIFTEFWERYHFDVLIRHSGEELVKECREAVESLYKNPNIDATVRRVFERSYLKILEPKVLSSFLQYLNDKFSDGLDLGDFYESLLPILGTQNELGQFRTPRHIIDFIVRVIDPSIGEKIADPACGTAGFLVSAFNYLKAKYTDNKGKLTLNPEQIKTLYNETIYGWDMEPLMVKFSLANLYLHDLKVPNVSENDTLLNENLWQHTFDIVIANPPFITPTGGAKRHSRFAITSNKTEVLFCEWMVHHLNFNGRMGIIVPEGIIFDGSRGHQAIRKLFLGNGLWCVVSLPSGVFQPYAGVKTSIIFLDKTLKPEQILFYEIENHGFSLNTNPVAIEKNDLPNALGVLKKYRGDLQGGRQTVIDEEKCYTIARQKILGNGTGNLSGRIYREKISAGEDKWKMVELGEVAEVASGNSAPQDKKLFENGRFAFFRTSDVGAVHIHPNLTATNDKLNEKGIKGMRLFPKGSILFPKSGASTFLNHRVVMGVDGYVSSHLAIVIPTEKILSNFLFHLLCRIDARTLTADQSYPSLRLSQMASIQIPLPPLKVQKEIVEQIEVKQKAIEAAKAVIQNLERERRYFVQTIRKLEGVEWVELGEVCDVLDSKRKPVTKADRTQGKYPYYGATGIVDYVDDYIFDEKLVLIGEDGAKWGVGEKTAFIAEGKYWVNNHAHVLRPDRNKILDEVLVAHINSIDLMPYITGVTVPKLNQEKMRSIKIPLLTIETQKQLVAEMEEQEKIIEANKRLIEIMEQKIQKVLEEI